MADAVDYKERLQHSLLDLGRRLLNGGDADGRLFDVLITADTVIYYNLNDMVKSCSLFQL